MRDIGLSPDSSGPLPLDVLDRWIAGTVTADDQRIIQAFLSEYPRAEVLLHVVGGGERGDEEAIGALRERVLAHVYADVGSTLGATARDVASSEAVSAVERRTPAEHAPSGNGHDRSRPIGWPGISGTRMSPRRSWRGYAAAAAAVLTIAVIGVGLSMTRGWRFPGRASSVKYATYATTNGQRATITLLDGTAVALDVGSRLDVPADYASGNRSVRLSGRALFTVSHHGGTPFMVAAGDVTTRVLGTTFMVRHYPSDSVTRVAVRDGRVAVNDTVVTASRMVVVHRNGAMQMRAATSTPFLFAAGILALDSMRLSDAIPELDRWYDVDVRLGDPSLGARVVEGRFPAGARSDVAEVLAWMFDARVVRDGRVLLLYPKTER